MAELTQQRWQAASATEKREMRNLVKCRPGKRGGGGGGWGVVVGWLGLGGGGGCVLECSHVRAPKLIINDGRFSTMQ